MRVRGIAICVMVFLLGGCGAGHGDASNAPPASPSAGTVADGDLQSKLEPYIECINRVDGSLQRSATSFFENAVPNPNDVVHLPPSAFKIEVYERDNSFSRGCIASLRTAASTPPSIPALDAAGISYATQLEKLLPTLNAVDSYYTERTYNDDNYRGARQYVATLRPRFVALFQTSDRMRSIVEEQNDVMKARELTAIEKSEGRDRRWHTLDVMIEARKLYDTGTRPGVSSAAMTLAVNNYAAAYSSGASYAAAHQPETSSANGSAMDIHKDGGWFYVSGPAERFLGQARDLQHDLRGPATTVEKERSAELFQSGFNAVVELYNQSVEMNRQTP